MFDISSKNHIVLGSDILKSPIFKVLESLCSDDGPSKPIWDKATMKSFSVDTIDLLKTQYKTKINDDQKDNGIKTSKKPLKKKLFSLKTNFVNKKDTYMMLLSPLVNNAKAVKGTEMSRWFSEKFFASNIKLSNNFLSKEVLKETFTIESVAVYVDSIFYQSQGHLVIEHNRILFNLHLKEWFEMELSPTNIRSVTIYAKCPFIKISIKTKLIEEIAKLSEEYKLCEDEICKGPTKRAQIPKDLILVFTSNQISRHDYDRLLPIIDNDKISWNDSDKETKEMLENVLQMSPHMSEIIANDGRPNWTLLFKPKSPDKAIVNRHISIQNPTKKPISNLSSPVVKNINIIPLSPLSSPKTENHVNLPKLTPQSQQQIFPISKFIKNIQPKSSQMTSKNISLIANHAPLTPQIASKVSTPLSLTPQIIPNISPSPQTTNMILVTSNPITGCNYDSSPNIFNILAPQYHSQVQNINHNNVVDSSLFITNNNNNNQLPFNISNLELSTIPITCQVPRPAPSNALMYIPSRNMTNVFETFHYNPSPESDVLIHGSDLLCLNFGQYLNDNIINFYLNFIRYEIMSEDQRSRTHLFNVFFHTKLQGSPLNMATDTSETRHARVAKWTKKVDIFDKDFIIIPINENQHWFLAIVCFPWMAGMISYDHLLGVHVNEPVSEIPVNETVFAKSYRVDRLKRLQEHYGVEPSPCILLFDSLQYQSRAPNVHLIREYLKSEWDSKRSATDGPLVFDKNTVRGFNPQVPQQTNSIDCGIFVLHYVEQFFNHPLTKFTKEFFQSSLVSWFNTETVGTKRATIQKMVLAKADLMNTQREATDNGCSDVATSNVLDDSGPDIQIL